MYGYLMIIWSAFYVYVNVWLIHWNTQKFFLWYLKSKVHSQYSKYELVPLGHHIFQHTVKAGTKTGEEVHFRLI